MEIVKTFANAGKFCELTVYGSPECPLFKASEVCNILDIRDATSSTRNFSEKHKQILVGKTRGGVQNVTYLTKKGVYKLIMRSKKPIASDFQDWVTDIISDIEQKGYYDVREDQSSNFARALCEANTHNQNTLVKAYNGKSVVYVVRIDLDNDDRFVIKLGETDNIHVRLTRGLRQEFGNALLLDAFECSEAHRFEQWLLKHPIIVEKKFTEAVNGRRSAEVILLDESFTLNDLLQLIKKHVKDFQGKTMEQRLLERQMAVEEKRLETVQQLLAAGVSDSTVLAAVVSKQYQAPTSSGHEEDAAPVETGEKMKPHTQAVQRYDADLKLCETYPSIADAARSCQQSRSDLISANQNKTLLGNSRWHFVDSENIIIEQDIGPTQQATKRFKGLTAQLSLDGTRIVEVHSNRVLAGKSVNKGSDTIADAIKKQRACQGFRWRNYDDCDIGLRAAFGEVSTAPSPNFHRKVQQLHPQTGELIQEYDTMTAVCSKFTASHKEINKHSRENSVYKGYRWKVMSKAKA